LFVFFLLEIVLSVLRIIPSDYPFDIIKLFFNTAKAIITANPGDRWFMDMVLNVTFNNISVISWQSVLLVEENGVPEKTTDQQQVTDKLLSHKVVWSRPCLIGIQMHNVNGYWH
jgi:hypothetical protein